MFKSLSSKIFLFFLGVILLLVFGRFFSLLSFPESQIVLNKGALVKVQEGEKTTQKFTAKRDGLSGMEVLLRTPGVRYEKGDQVKMEILDSNCEKTIRQGDLQPAFLNSDNLYEFRFKRIADSQEKNYCLLISPDKDNSKALRVFTMGKEKNQPLSVRPVYKNKYFWQNISELNQRISQYKPWFLKHYFLYLISFGFIIASIFLVMLLIFL